jgi:hypothetical protein
MTKPQTITIDDVKYVREDTIKAAVEIGEMRIIAADKGFVFVGMCEDQDDGSVIIRNAKNIRRWGTTKGLGELVSGPTVSTKYDHYGTVRCIPIISIAVTGGWHD